MSGPGALHRCSPTGRSAVSSPAGAITIDPWDPELVQPASVDVRLGDSFRVFHNHRTSAIDLRDPPTNLTEPIDDRARRAVRDPPGRVLPRRDARVRDAPRRHRRADRGQVVARTPRADRARDRRLLRSGLERHADARAQQPHARADQAVVRPADRPALVHDARRARPAAVRPRRARQPLPGAGRRDREPLRCRGRSPRVGS